MNKVVTSAKTPKAVGPYSAGIVAADTVYISGQLPLNAQGEMPETIEEQTRQVLKTLRLYLKARACPWRNVKDHGFFLSDIADFVAMNGVYAEMF